MKSIALRHAFLKGLFIGLGAVWPVLSGLILTMAGLGLLIGRLERWTYGESLYFAFVTGLTIGYGDFSPKTMLARVLAIVIGLCGILLTGLVAAVAVKAMTEVAAAGREKGS